MKFLCCFPLFSCVFYPFLFKQKKYINKKKNILQGDLQENGDKPENQPQKPSKRNRGRRGFNPAPAATTTKEN